MQGWNCCENKLVKESPYYQYPLPTLHTLKKEGEPGEVYLLQYSSWEGIVTNFLRWMSGRKDHTH
jgi:hypothetical protein